MAGLHVGAREIRTRHWAAIAVVVGLLAMGFPVAGGLPPPIPAGTGHAPAAPSARSALASPAAPAHPSGATNVTLGSLYSSSTLPPATANAPCVNQSYGPFVESSCLVESQNPSIVTLATGHFGVGYSTYTTLGPLCNATGNTSNLTSWTSTSVVWSESLTNASAWGPATVLGSPSCRWPSASEPSFATGRLGSVFGAYVLSNQTVNATGPSPPQQLFPPDWDSPTGDAIAFVHSANNGTTWTNATVLPNVTSAVRPQIAVFGKTIYVVYIFTNNSTASYPAGETVSGSVNALSVELVESPNQGATWRGPYVLPGRNSAMANWSTSPSLAVNATGAVSVAYATNRTCVENCFGYYGSHQYADQIVVATSLHNGSSWTGPTVAGNWTGESYTYSNYADNYDYTGGYQDPWMATPQTAIAYGPAGHTLYVAYSGTYVKSSIAYLNWQQTGVFAAYSANNGASWTNGTVGTNFSVANQDNFDSPGIAISGTTAYIAYVGFNESYCYAGTGCTGFVGLMSSWVASATAGGPWTSALAGISTYRTPAYTDYEYPGWESSVAISGAGTPVTATALEGQSTSGFSSTFTYATNYWTNVTIGYPYTGATTNVTFVENNLSAGTVWGVTVEGTTFTTNQTSLVVTNMPLGLAVPLAIVPVTTTAYRTQYLWSLSVASPYEFTGPTTIDVNYTLEYAVQFWLEPTETTANEILQMFVGSNFYFIECFDGYTYGGGPWYFPANTTLNLDPTSDPPVTYWNGTGNGSFTGGAEQVNLTLRGPVNETLWAGSYGVYTVGFSANNLPSNSTYSFAFAGGTHSSPAPNETLVPGVATGGYTVTNITATSSTPGWQYFGWVAGGSNTVVVPAQPTAAFDFAYVDVAASVGNLTFQAVGVGNGTVWSVQFNGTDYSSATPSLTVATKPGRFPWAVGAAVAANGSTGFAPVSVNATISVTTGETVNITYAPAYRIDVIAGLGGSASGVGSHWLTPASNATYIAAPGNGYGFVGWTGTGAGSYTGTNLTANVVVGGAITETASFYPLPAARFNVTFDETGIPSGAWWTVDLDGVGYSSNTSSLTVSDLLSCAAGTAGQYQESVGVPYATSGGATRYVAVNPTRQFCTDGGTVQPITFAAQYLVSVTATPGGSVYLADGNVESNSSVWAYANDTVELVASHDAGYVFGGWNGTGPGSYTGVEVDQGISPTGPVSELAAFEPVPVVVPPTYSVEFLASVAFPSGTSWTVVVDGASHAGIGASINVTGLSATTYTATVSEATASDGLTRWAPTSASVSVVVPGTGTQGVPFGSPSYWVSIGGSSGGTESPSSGWVPAGTRLALSATPNAGETFQSWTGTGPGNFTGTQPTGNATVGGPLTELATFQPVPAAAVAVSSIWSSGVTWAILGGVGLVVGLVVGLALRRLRSAPLAEARGAEAGAGSAGSAGSFVVARSLGGSP
jgi:hypothetical protein